MQTNSSQGAVVSKQIKTQIDRRMPATFRFNRPPDGTPYGTMVVANCQIDKYT